MIQIGSNENLYVSKVIQKAFIEVNEEGAEAAASTALLVAIDCALSWGPEIEVIANHPFIFILAQKLDHILFAGRISNINSLQ
jgi:serpin B